MGMGEAMLYGEVVTSTQTMLDRNMRLLSLLPTPLLALASHQLAGRGRGANVWLSPAGCLQFSLLLRVPLTALPGARIVAGAAGARVRLKWPNDLYAVLDDGEKKKIGGILVNTSFSSGKVELVVGCGLNVLNPPPITSLSQLLHRREDRLLSMERTAAVIMAKFERMWGTFLAHRGSFEPFMDIYLEHWLHSDQVVTLTTTTPPQKVRITGITSDYGLLRTVPERDGWSGSRGQS
ncbi:Biotin--protein ligase [Grifola frondosa]|uniref:Biotin--protein ligase n=1 Tax=Grifola frondosa TaxID=5627 RepID=A0A1C7LRI5_GRIFR|nr:Biotin--protein ligase [Grifola frondosa]